MEFVVDRVHDHEKTLFVNVNHTPMVTIVAGSTATTKLRSLEFISSFGTIMYEYNNMNRALMPVFDKKGVAIVLAITNLKLSAPELSTVFLI